MKFLDKMSWITVVAVALLLGLAPFTPEPHIVEKLRMLFQGTLVQPIDWFDLCLHGAPWVILILKIVRQVAKASRS